VRALELTLLASLLLPALPAAAGDEALGTLTVKGRTAVLRHTYVTREPDPEDPGREYIVFLLADSKLAPADRAPARLRALSQQGRLHALKVRWVYGFDDISCIPYHAGIDVSGQVVRGMMILDLRALDDRQVKAHVRSKMLGQDWHFAARLSAKIERGHAVEVETEAPAEALPADLQAPPDQITGPEAAGAGALKRRLGAMGLEATAEGFDQAVRDGNVEAVRAFLKLGMDPNAKDFRGEHVMMTAATFCAHPVPGGHGDRGEVVLALLAGGSDVHGGQRPAEALTLIWAAQHCPPPVVQAMIKAGADVNARAPGSATPMMMAGFRQDAHGPAVQAILKKAGAREWQPPAQ
jgi:hypothetical protein